VNANAHLPLEGGRVLSQAKEAGGVIAAVLDVPSRRRTAVTTPPGGFVATLPSRGRETLHPSMQPANPQQPLHHLRLRRKLRRRSRPRHTPALQDDRAISEIQRALNALLDQDHRHLAA
jgi:hypothetical protein